MPAPDDALPYTDSRRLLGSNLHFAGPGAVLEALWTPDAAVTAEWRERVGRARAALGWPADAPLSVRAHARGVTLALGAPLDQLFTATEVNEWALCAASRRADPARFRATLARVRAEAAAEQGGEFEILDAFLGDPDLDDGAALRHLRERAAREAAPRLRALAAEAHARGLPFLMDDDALTIGAGAAHHGWPLGALPRLDQVPWDRLASVPTALVTGSNGKTTVVRLIAAMLRAQGLATGHSCTDGVVVAGETLQAGDYSGPLGARTVLRHPAVEAAVLETARGGILRRGLAVERADVAVITNISADHYGEHGIDDLRGLAAAKLAVRHALRRAGGDAAPLVLNADDATLQTASAQIAGPIAWFAADHGHPSLVAGRAAGGATCAIDRGRLRLTLGGATHDLGPVDAMPLTCGGAARHNALNLAAAALAAATLGVSPAAIGAVAATFGADAEDNPGRLMRFERGGVAVVVDYAHNADGLRQLAPVIARLRGARGRLVMLLGHAGDRLDEDVRALAREAAALGPDRVVVKAMPEFARGRDAVAVADGVAEGLRAAGLASDRIVRAPDELAAVRQALEWARPGDLALLLVHARAAREATLALLR